MGDITWWPNWNCLVQKQSLGDMWTERNINYVNVYQILLFVSRQIYFILLGFQNLCGFQVSIASDGDSRGKKQEDEQEGLGHAGRSPHAHHHLSHAPWQEGRPGAQQGGFLGDRG